MVRIMVKACVWFIPPITKISPGRPTALIYRLEDSRKIQSNTNFPVLQYNLRVKRVIRLQIR